MNSSQQLFTPETLSAMSPAAKSHLGLVQEQLEVFLDDHGATAPSLAALSQAELLHEFMTCTPPMIFDKDFAFVGISEKAQLISYEQVDDTYKHLPIIMALAHEGGSIWSMTAPYGGNQGLNIKSLVKRLSMLSPQQLICTSGLLPSATSTQMFRDLMKQMIAKHASFFEAELLNGPEGEGQNMRHWFWQMEQLTGECSLETHRLDISVTTRQLNALDQRLEEFDLGEYEYLMSSLISSDDSYAQYDVLDHLFFSDAFMMLEQSEDTALVLKVLTAKARFWAGKLDNYFTRDDDLTEQLLACALFTHPEHFKRAGFGMRNLIGINPQRANSEKVKDILSGPLAFFSSSRQAAGQTFGLDRLLTYTKALVPEVTVDEVLEHSNLLNTRAMALLTLQGGHSPVIEMLLAEGSLPSRWSETLLDVIGETQSHAIYHPYSLAKMLSQQMKRIKCSNTDSPLNPDGLSYFDSARINRSRMKYFAPAMAANGGLKDELIDCLRGFKGVSAEHFQITGIDASEAKDVVAGMSLQEQGKLFSVDLGL
ncbi:hypothetical protein V0M98_34515 (plasmid) [Pseudomonas silesiensis]|uniref:hypothetical protein n=1 Tax=Pseudomonas silesiensis TaxID=1853130 RepID=UPI0030D0BED4